MESGPQLTQLLRAWSEGDQGALEQLVPLSMKSCIGWRDAIWPTSVRGTLCKPPPWSMKCTSGSRMPIPRVSRTGLIVPLAARDENPRWRRHLLKMALPRETPCTDSASRRTGTPPATHWPTIPGGSSTSRFSPSRRVSNLLRSGPSNKRRSTARIRHRGSGAGISRTRGHCTAMFVPCKICTLRRRSCRLWWRSTIRTSL